MRILYLVDGKDGKDDKDDACMELKLQWLVCDDGVERWRGKH